MKPLFSDRAKLNRNLKMPQKKIELHIAIDTDQAMAVNVLAARTNLSKQAIKKAMQKGCVWLTRDKYTQRLRRVKKPLKKGDELSLYFDESVLNQEPPRPVLIADEGKFSIWDKPFGLLSQGSKWGDHMSLPRWAELNLKPQRNAFIVHRLDRAATGLIMLAHSKKAAAELSRLFQARDIEKHYQVLVEGEFSEQLTFNDALDGKASITHAVLNAYFPERQESLLDIHIETGRKHQIRRHLSMHGFPVVGDRLYGNGSAETKNLQLRSVKLAFASPFDNQQKVFSITGIK